VTLSTKSAKGGRRTDRHFRPFSDVRVVALVISIAVIRGKREDARAGQFTLCGLFGHELVEDRQHRPA
jgi:hypothetical protein